MPLMETLRESELFAGVDGALLEKIAAHSSIRHYPKGGVLFYENDSIDKLYYMIEGSVKIYKVDRFESEIFLYTVGARDFITELTSFGAMGCFANAEFIREGSVIMMEYGRLKEIINSNTLLLQRFFELFARRVKMLQCIINREIVFDGTAKVAHLLDSDLEFVNANKRTTIAQMLNIQPETLSRILKKIERREIVKIKREEIVVLDGLRLKEIYEGGT